MRIAVFIKSTTFHQGFGGLETQNKVLCEGLVKYGCEVVVFSPQKELDLKKTQQNGVMYKFVPCVYRLGIASGMDKNNWINRSYQEFLKANQGEAFDLIISQSSAGLGVIKKKAELGVKIVAISHGSIIGEWKTRAQSVSSFKDLIRLAIDTIFVLRVFFGRQREFLHGADKVIAVSGAVKEALVNEAFLPEDKIVTIYNGMDASFINELAQKEENRPVGVIYIGRIHRSKGVFGLLRMFENPTFKNVKLEIVGDGEDLKKLKNSPYAVHLGNMVTFHGRLTHELAVKKLKQADIFALPTLRVEGFPMTLVEAMHASLPIVAFAIGGIPDAIEDGKTGFLVPQGDFHAFEEKLLVLINNAGLRKEMGQKAKEKAENEFSVDIMIDKYMKVFEGISK